MPLTDIDGQRLGDSVADKLGNRNLVINGNFRIDQRNSGGSITTSAGNNFPVDRWLLHDNAGSDFTSEQDTDAPAGFDFSLLVTSAAATSPGSNDYYFVCQRIEGNNVAHLDFGSSDAETVTISFYVKSSLTGTFSGALGNSSFNRAYPFTYTISSANTWEQKTVTIAGDTAGTWATDNTTGLQVVWDLGSGTNRVGTAGAWVGSDKRGVTGSTQIVATSGATFRLAGVQVEVGNTATPFENKSYQDELAKCQRYFQKSYNQGHAPGSATSTGTSWVTIAQGGGRITHTAYLSTPMRATPTLTLYDWAGASGKIRTQAGNGQTASASYVSEHSVTVDANDVSITECIFQYTCEAEL
jgi:hypothetical protein